MSGFQVGDVVVCIDDSPCVVHPYAGYPFEADRGSLYRVARVGLHPVEREFYLGLTEVPGVMLFAARFRKVTRADEQFIEQMRALKPAMAPADP